MKTLIPRIQTWLGFTISNEVLMLFFDRMAVVLRSGRSIGAALVLESTYGNHPELRQICAAISARVQNGASLCDTLRPYETRFPELVIRLLEVGEASGGLADAAQRLANTFRQTSSFDRKFRFGVYDPRLVLLLICLLELIGLIILNLMPNNSDSRPVPDKSIAEVAISILLTVAGTAAGLTVQYLLGRGLLFQVYRLPKTRLIVDTIKLALPRLGLVTRNLSAARWARSFAVLWGAGINISTALEISSRSALNAHYERAMCQAAVRTRQGVSLTQSLADTQLLPTFLLTVIANCEKVGTFDEGLLKLAADMETEALTRGIEEMNKIVQFGYGVLVLLVLLYVLVVLTAAGV